MYTKMPRALISDSYSFELSTFHFYIPIFGARETFSTFILEKLSRRYLENICVVLILLGKCFCESEFINFKFSSNFVVDFLLLYIFNIEAYIIFVTFDDRFRVFCKLNQIFYFTQFFVL